MKELTTVNCPRCGGTLDGRQVIQVKRLAERDNELCFFVDGNAPSDFDVRCHRASCEWTFYGSWRGLAKTLGRTIAERP